MDHYDLLRRMFFGPGLRRTTSRPPGRPEDPRPLDLRRLTAPARPTQAPVEFGCEEEEPLGA